MQAMIPYSKEELLSWAVKVRMGKPEPAPWGVKVLSAGIILEKTISILAKSLRIEETSTGL